MSMYYRLPAMLRYWKNRVQDRLSRAPESLHSQIVFRCNICGEWDRATEEQLTREAPTCRCGSSVRVRAIIHVLTLETFGKSLAIPEIPRQPQLKGVDMTGASVYADRIVRRISYTNTYLHKEPCLDITSPGDQWLSSCDFLISSDVFEHVAPPVNRAFANALQILRPGGVMVLTVPFMPTGDTVEHFPELHEYRIEQRSGKPILINRTRNGKIQEFDDLVFHGGKGETLEMRVFSESGVIAALTAAGFVDIRIHQEPIPEFGIYWQNSQSLPFSARRPGG